MTASAVTSHPLSALERLCRTRPHASARAHTLTHAHTHGSVKTQKGPVIGSRAPSFRTEPVVGRHLGALLSQGSRIINGLLGRDSLAPGSVLLRPVPCTSRTASSPTALEQPSAPLIGASVKNGPKMCFSSAPNVFAIESRCGELKEWFSGWNEMT